MARTTRKTPPPADDDFTENIVDIDVSDEMQGSYLEYAYSVIYSRALPDARDGLKPVHRRILYRMTEMGLRPDRGHVKCARVVGDVMATLHPHGDTAIYDTLVRMAQPWSLRLPLVDGHGNFGSLGNDDPPAAYRYTECRLTPAAMAVTTGIDEGVVDLRPNYDDREMEPEVLPAAFPNLLVNGASGIAVGMATNMPPHNLVEVISAARHLIAHPNAGLDDLMRFVPGPDLPTGGKIVGLDGIREAYETGRGTFRTRATARVENVTPRRKGIVITELPWGVGPERVKEKIAELVRGKKLQGITAVDDYTDRTKGLRLVIEIKNGFNPEAILEQLYRLTPIEDTFGINNVALVDGQPRTLGLKELLEVYIAHRLDVVRRRSLHRRTKAQDRLHLVDGLLVAILDIDEVIQVIRTSDDAAEARERLMSVFDLSETQTNYILDMPLRRLTKFSRIELEAEQETLRATIAALTEIIDSESLLRKTVSDELAEIAKQFGTPRRTVLLESAGAPSTDRRPARGHRRPVLGAAVLHRPAGPHPDRRPAADRGRPRQARRPRLRRAGHRAGRGRRRHHSGPAAAPRRPRRAGGAGHRQRAQPLRWRPGLGVPVAGQGRAGGRAVRPGRRQPRARAGHRAGRDQAGPPRPPAEQGHLGGHRPQARRPGRRRGRAHDRGARPGVRHLRRAAAALRRGRGTHRKAGPRAAWPASGWPAAPGSCTSAPSIPRSTTWS